MNEENFIASNEQRDSPQSSKKVMGPNEVKHSKKLSNSMMLRDENA